MMPPLGSPAGGIIYESDRFTLRSRLRQNCNSHLRDREAYKKHFSELTADSDLDE
jgi:hypothetical protein